MRPSFQLLTLRRPRRRARCSSAVSMSTPKPKRWQKPTVKTVKTVHATPNATTKGDSGKKFLGTSLVRFTSLNYSSRKLSSSGLEWPALDDKKQNMFTNSDYRTLAFGITKCHRKHPARISSDTNVLSRLQYVELCWTQNFGAALLHWETTCPYCMLWLRTMPCTLSVAL